MTHGPFKSHVSRTRDTCCTRCQEWKLRKKLLGPIATLSFGEWLKQWVGKVTLSCAVVVIECSQFNNNTSTGIREKHALVNQSTQLGVTLCTAREKWKWAKFKSNLKPWRRRNCLLYVALLPSNSPCVPSWFIQLSPACDCGFVPWWLAREWTGKGKDP